MQNQKNKNNTQWKLLQLSWETFLLNALFNLTELSREINAKSICGWTTKDRIPFFSIAVISTDCIFLTIENTAKPKIQRNFLQGHTIKLNVLWNTFFLNTEKRMCSFKEMANVFFFFFFPSILGPWSYLAMQAQRHLEHLLPLEKDKALARRLAF